MSRIQECTSFTIEHKETGSSGACHANAPRELERGIAAAARSTRPPPPEAAWLPGDWLESKPLGDSRGDQPQQRIAQTGDDDTQYGKGAAEHDRAV